MKEHYFVIKWTEKYGWETDDETLAVWSNDRPIYDIGKYEWLRVPTKGKDNKLDQMLCVALAKLIDHANKTKKSKTKKRK